MDTSRIVINTIDNSTSYVEQSTGVVGFTVVKAPKGSITPRKILAGGASKIKDIFGEATEEYPELFEVETFNKEYDIYVSAPYSSAKVPVAYLTDKGVFIKKDTVDYTEKLEKYILEGDTSDDIENISTFNEDPIVYKKCDIEYKTITEDETETTGILIDTNIIGANIDSNGNIITIKGLLSSLNSNFKLTKTGCSVVDADGKDLSTRTVSVNIYEKNGEDSFKKVTDNPSTIIGNVYLLVTDASNIIKSTYSVDSNFKELSSYIETTLDKNDIYATILPKYPSERKLHISFVPFNDLKGYSYKVLSQRNILKINAYEENAFHNVYSPIYIEGTLDKKSTSSVSPFTNTNESLTNQELVAVIPINSFTKESLSIEPKYDSIVLEGGERNFEVEESTEGAGDAITSVKLHDIGWETVKKEDLDDVDIFFTSEYHNDYNELKKSVFFELGVTSPQNKYSVQNNRFSGHIFNYTPSNPNTITEKLSFGRNYWNICNLAVIDLPNGGRILSPMTGARALMQCRIIEGAYGGVAPMWENSKGMGGQLNMISPYRVKYKYTKEQLDNLDLYNYNPVIYDRQYGLMCVGQKTCKDGEITDWSYIGHACAFMVFIKQIRKYVMLPQIGKKNNPYYRTLRKEQVQQYLRDRISGTDRIWSEGIVDTSTADGVNDINAQRARCFRILVKVKVDTFSEYVELNFYNEDQTTTIGTDF